LVDKYYEKYIIKKGGKKLKILYVTDLDGTLLNNNQRLSKFTINLLNELIDSGMCFSYATARSLSTASIVTRGLITNIPVILYNGTIILNAYTKEKLYSLYFNNNEKETIINSLHKHNINPLVYGFVNNEEKVSWIRNRENTGIQNYKNSRKNDERLRPVDTEEELYQGEIFYITCIEYEKLKLEKIYNYFKENNNFNCTLQKSLYNEEYWFEIMLKKANKGNAIIKLKELLKCDKVITFGDAVNDIPMFKISDECYAVENAAEELKRYAMGTIKSNEKDGVAHWLEENYKNK
jgi:Cof subfamily protein (haloacid dehalogenase superfamily)